MTCKLITFILVDTITVIIITKYESKTGFQAQS